ncbi:MAG: Gfo/Idh/MocA family oxidoreductase, partial [Spirochaetaceae bacterium]|nr:Gfo/Idh/MocA family oxidoreductase [Spirochaetaceae bacterium]
MAESRIVDGNPVMEALGRRLRLAVIGGGPGSFIGEMHRAASRLDDRYRIVAAALSSDAERARAAARQIGVPDERAYGSGTELIEREAARADGADVVAIMTPNETHREYCVAALERGFDVICDKPLANSLDDALAVVRAVRESGKVFVLTHNYTGYPMVRQARAMVAAGQLGDIRLVQVEYVQGGNAAADAGSGGVRWRFDPARSGPSLILGDIGTHAHHLVCYVAGVELQAVAADVGAIVPGRTVHDYAGVLLRFAGGARGCLWATQAAAGMESSLGVRVSGAAGTLEGHQDPAKERRV